MTIERPYDFGPSRKAARQALSGLSTMPEDALAAAVGVALEGRMRRDLVLGAVLARKLRRERVRDVAKALGGPGCYTMRERSRVATWLSSMGEDPSEWIGHLDQFPLEARLMLEGFAAARIEIASRPGAPEVVRALRDTALLSGAIDTMAELVDTGWLDEMVLEPPTIRVVLSLRWADHGTSVLDFARRVRRKRNLLASVGGDSGHFGAIIDLVCGRARSARDTLAAHLPAAAAPYLLACARLDGRDTAGALESVHLRPVFNFLLTYARLPAHTRASQVIAEAAALPLPGPSDPLRADFVRTLARAVEVGRASATDRLNLESYLRDIPTWRELLPAADAAWLRAARALEGPKVAPALAAAALHDLLLVEPLAPWFVAVADRLLQPGRERWLVDDYGEATALGVQVHALVGHVVAGVPAADLSAVQQGAIHGFDVVATLRAARGLAAGQPQLLDQET